MDDVRVVFVDFPPHIKGSLVKMFDGDDYYTVVLNSQLNREQQLKTYLHELEHMNAKDFDEVDKSADEIEYVRHYE